MHGHVALPRTIAIAPVLTSSATSGLSSRYLTCVRPAVIAEAFVGMDSRRAGIPKMDDAQYLDSRRSLNS